jgi:hypothetical protein
VPKWLYRYGPLLGTSVGRLYGTILGTTLLSKWHHFGYQYWHRLRYHCGTILGAGKILGPLKPLRKGQHFRALLKSNDAAVRNACFELALPNA